MTILITGATGLVGSRLLPRLVDAGVDCRALVRPGRTVLNGVATVEGDLLDPESLASAVEGVSAIVHLAAVLRVLDPDEFRRANVEGTQNLIAAAKAHAPEARIIMASTGLVYNDDIPRPAREDDPANPTRAYRRASSPQRTHSGTADSLGVCSASGSCTVTATDTCNQHRSYSAPGTGTPHRR